MATYNHILVPLDGSELAEEALALALRLAEKTHARVTLLRVIPPPSMTIRPSAHHNLTEAAEHDAAHYLQQVMNTKVTSGMDVQIKLLRGDVADSITYFIKKHSIDLLIISSHGRSGLSRLFLGSVAEALLKQVPCPVLVTRANEEMHLLCHKLMPLDITVDKLTEATIAV